MNAENSWVGWQADGKRLISIAELMEREAESWCEGFAIWKGDRWDWSTTQEEWAYVRYFKLVNAAQFLRAFAARQAKRQKTSPVNMEAPRPANGESTFI